MLCFLDNSGICFLIKNFQYREYSISHLFRANEKDSMLCVEIMQSQLRWFLLYRSVQSDYLISTLSAYCVLNVSICIVLVIPWDFLGEEMKGFIKPYYYCKAEFLNLSTLDIWVRQLFVVGASCAL